VHDHCFAFVLFQFYFSYNHGFRRCVHDEALYESTFTLPYLMYIWTPDLDEIYLGVGLRSPSALLAVEVVR